jgi:hypothetical protein
VRTAVLQDVAYAALKMTLAFDATRAHGGKAGVTSDTVQTVTIKTLDLLALNPDHPSFRKRDRQPTRCLESQPIRPSVRSLRLLI